MDDKNEIFVNTEFYLPLVDKDECLPNISKEFARLFMYANYSSGATHQPSWVWEDGSYILWEDSSTMLTES